MKNKEHLRKYLDFLETKPAAVTHEATYQEYRRSYINQIKTDRKYNQRNNGYETQQHLELLDQHRNQFLADRKQFQQENCIATSLPLDLLIRIFRNLNDKELCIVAFVCQNWNRAANHPSLWNFNLLPEYRGDSAKKIFLQNPKYRVTQTYFFQLINRLNSRFVHQLRAMYDIAQNDLGKEVEAANNYYNNIGISMHAEIIETEVLAEIDNLLRLGRCVSPTQVRDNDEPISPLQTAIRSRNLRAIQILVENGASNLDIFTKEVFIDPEIFAYVLDIYPSLYQDKAKYHEYTQNNTAMQKMYFPQQKPIAMMEQTQRMLDNRRHEYLQQQSKGKIR